MLLTLCILTTSGSVLAQMPDIREAYPALAEGGKRINLSLLIGKTPLQVLGAWMLDYKTCALVYQTDADESLALMLLDTQSITPISSLPLPQAADIVKQGWDGNVFYLNLRTAADEQTTENQQIIQTRITRDYQVSLSAVLNLMTLMPDGRTAIREDEDGSLCDVDIASHSEKRLLQGVLIGFLNKNSESAYEKYKRYIPMLMKLIIR